MRGKPQIGMAQELKAGWKKGADTARRTGLRVLYLTHHLPFPPVSGGRRRDYELIRRLGRDARVHVVAISKTYDEDLEAAAEFANLCDGLDVLRATPGQLNGECEQLARHQCFAARSYMAALLARERFDVVHVEGFYLLQHLPWRIGIPVLLTEHNLEYELWKQRARLARDRGTARLLLDQAKRTHRDEVWAWERADALVAVTEEDRIAMETESKREVALVPGGADHLAEYTPSQERASAKEKPPTVVLAANFGYQPNVDAAHWLCAEILPLIRNAVPDVRVELVGNCPNLALNDIPRDARIDITGRVPDVTPYLDAADVVVCPLRVGGGVKVKVLEALSRGLAVVTTSVGAQGLGASTRTALRLSDDAAGVAAHVIGLLLDPDERHRQRERAREAANSLPTWDQAAAATRALYGRFGTSKGLAAFRVG
jgi:glycosyltransferase involved in cell wall biosynthesis